MAAPTNTSFGTATDLGAVLPIANTQSDINDAGVNYTVYYKFTCPAGLKMVWVLVNSENTTGYMPKAVPYDMSHVEILTESADAPLANNPIQFPVTPGQVHYVVAVKNVDSAGPEHANIQIKAVPDTAAIPNGAIVINGDIANQPCGVFSGTVSYSTVKFIQGIAVGEGGDITPTGRLLLDNRIPANKFIALYSGNDLTELGRDSTMLAYSSIRYNRTTGKFWILVKEDPSFCKLYKLDPTILPLAKTLMATITGTGSAEGISTNTNETIAYYQKGGAFGLGVKRWNLSTNLAMTDLVAAPSVDYYFTDSLVLEDDTILVGWTNGLTTGGLVKVRQYDSSGTLLNSFDFNSWELGNYGFVRLAYAQDSPASFWVKLRERTATEATGDGIFKNIRISDGVVVTSVNHLEYHERNYIGPSANSYRGESGIWNCCPFVVYPVGAPASPSGIYVFVASKRDDIGSAIPNPTFKTGLIP